MPTTAQKAMFDEAYHVFGADYQGKQMLDWSNYVKNIDGKNYYVWVDLKPYYDSNRIPYYNFNKTWIDKAPFDGYLPAGVTEFYFQMRPISYVDSTGAFRKALTSYKSLPGKMQPIDIYDKSGHDFISAAIVHLFDGATGKYKSVVVPINRNLFSVSYYCLPCDESEPLKESFLLWNKSLRDCAKTLMDQFNYAVTIQSQPGYSNLKAEYKAQIVAMQKDAASRIEALMADPYVYGKKCAECAKNATIGAIPLVVIIVALALTALTVVSVKMLDNKRALDQQRLQAQRSVDALKEYREVLADKNLSKEEKEKYFGLTQSTVENANAATTAATKDSPGFFDRIENLLFLAGGFLILNNVTKKN